MDGSQTYTSGGTLNLPDLTYKINGAGGSQTNVLLPLYSTSISPNSCPITAYFYIWNDISNIWEDKSTMTTQPFTGFIKLDTGTTHTAGTLTVYQTSVLWIPEIIYKVKIRLVDLQSSDPVKNAIETTLEIDVYHAC